MVNYLRADNEDELIELSRIYHDSVCANGEDEIEEKKSKELKEYLEYNKGKLKSYKSVIRNMPKTPEGIMYKNMGVQENQNCTVITLRMKGEAKTVGGKKCKSHGKTIILS